jgi:hypothetical protein
MSSNKLPDEIPHNAFLASMPWWVVSRRRGGEGAAGGGAGYLVLDADGSTCLAVFTDEDLAERFTRTVGYDGRPAAARTPRQFIALAAGLPPVCTYVAFDPPPKVGGRARWVVPLRQVLTALDVIDDAGRERPGAGDEESKR